MLTIKVYLNSMPHKIIGGIKPCHINSWKTEESILYLTNARSALFIVADLLNPKTVWMPSYYCPSMLESFQNHTVKFYNVDENLRSDIGSINSSPGDLVIAINYFGFPTARKTIEYSKKRKCYTLEDCSTNSSLTFIILSNNRFSIFDGYETLEITASLK